MLSIIHYTFLSNAQHASANQRLKGKQSVLTHAKTKHQHTHLSSCSQRHSAQNRGNVIHFWGANEDSMSVQFKYMCGAYTGFHASMCAFVCILVHLWVYVYSENDVKQNSHISCWCCHNDFGSSVAIINNHNSHIHIPHIPPQSTCFRQNLMQYLDIHICLKKCKTWKGLLWKTCFFQTSPTVFCGASQVLAHFIFRWSCPKVVQALSCQSIKISPFACNETNLTVSTQNMTCLSENLLFGCLRPCWTKAAKSFLMSHNILV